MTRRPKTVRPDLPVRALQQLFLTHGFNGFPVVDDAGTLLGIVTKLDLLRIFRPDRRRLLPDLRALWAERVEDIMRGRVVTLAPDDALTTAVDRMLGPRLRSVPVVERHGGKDVLVGIVSRGDIVGHLVFETAEPRRGRLTTG